MKSVWMQSAGELFLIERFDDGSYGVEHADEFLGFVARCDHEYIAIAGDDGSVLGEAATLGAAANLLAAPLKAQRTVAANAA